MLYELVPSYTGKMQHSVWVAEVINSNLEVASASVIDAIPADVLAKQFSFRRIWQGKGAQTAACKVPCHIYYSVSLDSIFSLSLSIPTREKPVLVISLVSISAPLLFFSFSSVFHEN